MFRDDAQAARALGAVLAAAGLQDLWSPTGPTPWAATLLGDPGGTITPGQHLVLQVASALWERRVPPPVPFDPLHGDVDRVTCAALFSLVTACLSGPAAVDTWLGATAACLREAPPAPAPAGASGWIDKLGTDWPTVDLLSLRYVRAVVALHDGDVARAAKVLDVNRRTLARILAKAERGRVPNLHTRA